MEEVTLPKAWFTRLTAISERVTKEMDTMNDTERQALSKTGIHILLGYISSAEMLTETKTTNP